MEIYAEKTFSPIFIKIESLEEASSLLYYLELCAENDDPEIIQDIIEDLKELVKPYKNYPDKIKTTKTKKQTKTGT
jgi:hypothetical protein